MCVRILYLQQPRGHLHPLISARPTRPTACTECNFLATRNFLKTEAAPNGEVASNWQVATAGGGDLARANVLAVTFVTGMAY
jgi:hypothetical protein